MKLSQKTNELLILGQSIRTFRENKGLSQEQFAEACGLDRSYISRLERGIANPSYIVLSEMAKALAIKIHELLPP